MSMSQLVVFFLIFAAIGFSQGRISSLEGAAIAASVAGVVAVVIWRYARAKTGAFSKLGSETRRHIETLVRKRAQLVAVDDYGRENSSSWRKELEFFISNVVAQALPKSQREALLRGMTEAVSLVEEQVKAAHDAKRRELDYRPEFSPREFEEFCASTLANYGWTTRVVGQSGDQGADVVATKSGFTAVIQCKKYSDKVGNAAVQEVHGAKAHYLADVAVVVTNAEYTPAARGLATTTGVVLLHVSDLTNFDRLVVTNRRSQQTGGDDSASLGTSEGARGAPK